MSCQCNIVGLLSVNYQGIISASVTGSTNFIYVLQSCFDGVTDKILKGPSTGTINITAYGYLPGEDKYRGVHCPSKAGVSIPLFSKFDCERNFTRFMPRRGGQAYMSGDPIDGITLINEACSFNVMDASAQNGPFSPYFIEVQHQGTGLIWTGPPIPIDTSDTGTVAYTIDIAGWSMQAFLNSFSIDITPPQGARVQYSFQYDIADCSVGPGQIIPIDDLISFEFLACDSISISYQQNGMASISFSVFSNVELPTRDFSTITVGGAQFDGYVTTISIIPVPGTAVYEHRYSWVGISHPA